MMTRRTAVTLALAGASLPLTGCERRQRLAGLQLYSVREAMAQDVPATLARIAGIGYREVEFAGYFGHSPAEIRRILADTGLAAPSAHVGAGQVRDDPVAAIEACLEAGHAFAVVAWIPEEERRTADDWRGWADAFNRFGEQASAAGLRFAYHNHDFEFAPSDGPMPFDILLSRCRPDRVAFELDLYWVRAAGADAMALLRDNPGRFPLCHAKDMAADGSMAPVGEGVIDFAAILDSEAGSQFEHIYAEHDNPADPFAFAETSYRALSHLLA